MLLLLLHLCMLWHLCMLLHLCLLFYVLLYRMVGICRLSGSLWAWLQETCPVRHSHSEHPRQTSCSSRWRHRQNTVPPAQHILWRSLRPPDGCWRWMQDVVRQLVGFGLVAGHVMNLKGSQRAATHGEMLHAPSMHAHVWAVLTSALHVLYRFCSILLAVHSGHKLWPECAGPNGPRRWPAGGQRRYFTPVLEGCKPERRYTHNQAFTIFLLQYLALVCTNAFRLLKPVSNPVFHFCESIWAEIFYDHYAYYSHYNIMAIIRSANAHNVL